MNLPQEKNLPKLTELVSGILPTYIPGSCDLCIVLLLSKRLINTAITIMYVELQIHSPIIVYTLDLTHVTRSHQFYFAKEFCHGLCHVPE